MPFEGSCLLGGMPSKPRGQVGGPAIPYLKAWEDPFLEAMYVTGFKSLAVCLGSASNFATILSLILSEG